MNYWKTPESQYLRKISPWPDVRPNVPPLMHTWFTDKNAEMLKRAIPWNARCIVELGSWYGGSALWLAENYPNALIICVDIWAPYPEILTNPDWAQLQPGAYEHFLQNLWEYRHRVIPIRSQTSSGLAAIRIVGVEPDAVYIDANHTEISVASDVYNSARLFPRAALIGDDWGRPEVRLGVVRGLRRIESEAPVVVMENRVCWAFVRDF